MNVPILSAVCDEPEGKVERFVYPLIFTPENLQKFWDRAKQFPTIYGREIKGIEDFYHMFINTSDKGEIDLNGLFWVIDDFVGVFYMTDITPYQANVHYSFFDKRHKGRLDLVKKMLRYIFNRYHFKRINVEIPLYATKYTRFFVSNLGFTLEGRKRKAAYFRGEWWDVMQYGMLDTEAFNRREDNGNEPQD